MNPDSIARTIAAGIVIMDDAAAAARYIYNMSDKHLTVERGDKKTIEDFIIRIIEIVSTYDELYSVKIASEYMKIIFEGPDSSVG
tara:strand:+ start:2474 stop:2728 length:255 start_codon:yes stop_codon:yes gene_type:complete